IASEPNKKARKTATQAAAPPAGRVGLGGIFAAAALAAVVAAGVGLGRARPPPPGARGARGAGRAAGGPAGPGRPARGAGAPGGACGDANGGGASCVGVSTYAASDEEARAQAMDAALEAAAARVGTGVADSNWQRLVAAVYAPARQQGLEPNAAATRGQAGRSAVAAALRKTAAGVPAQPAAAYWERFEAAPGAKGTRTLAFVRIASAAAELPGLATPYRVLQAPPNSLGDAKVWTPSPGLAWRAPTLRGGAELASVDGGPLRDAGLTAGDIVVEVEGKPV